MFLFQIGFLYQWQLIGGRAQIEIQFTSNNSISLAIATMEKQRRLKQLKRHVQKVDKVLKFALDRCTSSNNNYSNHDGSGTLVGRALRISSKLHLEILKAELRKPHKN